jgi:hypothetical protein
MGQSREAHHPARPLHSPEGGMSRTCWVQPLLQEVADYTRVSAVLAAGCAGAGRVSEPQYLGMRARALGPAM